MVPLPKNQQFLPPRDLDQQLFRMSLLHYLPRIKDEDLLEPRGVLPSSFVEVKNITAQNAILQKQKKIHQNGTMIEKPPNIFRAKCFFWMNFIDLCFVTLEFTLNDKAQIWGRSSSNQTHGPRPSSSKSNSRS